MLRVVKITVTGGQVRITIPKEIALKVGYLSKDGKAGKTRRVALTTGPDESLNIHSVDGVED